MDMFIFNIIYNKMGWQLLSGSFFGGWKEKGRLGLEKVGVGVGILGLGLGLEEE